MQSCGGTTVTVGQAVTDSNGAFTISDTPPAPGTYTYNVILFNTSIDAYATATGVVVAYPDQMVLHMPSTALPNQAFDASGWLTFASGASADGKTVTITRANPDGTTTTITATTGTKGSFSFRDDPPADGTYTYTATYADSTGTITADTSATVTVAKET